MSRVRQAWRLYQTDSQIDTVLAIVMVAALLYPFVQTWREVRSGGR